MPRGVYRKVIIGMATNHTRRLHTAMIIYVTIYNIPSLIYFSPSVICTVCENEETDDPYTRKKLDRCKSTFFYSAGFVSINNKCTSFGSNAAY
jgi:hypothetical protein